MGADRGNGNMGWVRFPLRFAANGGEIAWACRVVEIDWFQGVPVRAIHDPRFFDDKAVEEPGELLAIAVGDRAYYVHGPFYYVEPARYVWVRGHWAWRHHHRVWIHGYYVIG